MKKMNKKIILFFAIFLAFFTLTSCSKKYEVSFVVDGKTQSTPITIYKYNDGKTYIVLSGLAEGDMIIAEGAGLMREGTAVNTESSTEPIK